MTCDRLMLLRNKKALSPVISAIILIAVTVAVATAVAMWMGSISFTFMEVDEFRVISHSWASDNSYIDLDVKNFGTGSITISGVEVNDEIASSISYPSGDATLEAGESNTIRVKNNILEY